MSEHMLYTMIIPFCFAFPTCIHLADFSRLIVLQEYSPKLICLQVGLRSRLAHHFSSQFYFYLRGLCVVGGNVTPCNYENVESIFGYYCFSRSVALYLPCCPHHSRIFNGRK